MDTYSVNPEVEIETAGGIRLEPLDSRIFNNGTIFLHGEVNMQMARDFTEKFLFLREKKGSINIIINSPGGVIDAGMIIYDLIQAADFPINMYCAGNAYSMAAVLLAGGQKGRRFIFPHSSVMIHEPLVAGGNGGSASTIQKTAESLLRIRDSINDILAKHTGRTREEVDEATKTDNFMSAEEAVAFGICDKIKIL